MNELSDLVLLVLGIFATMSGLLYVLTAIDPQTDKGHVTLRQPRDK